MVDGKRCLSELFQAQAERTPDAAAVAFEDQVLSYRQLDLRANRLANHLRDLGVRAETLVGLCLERSVDLVIGVLGVLKAGAAYVPLDPTHPAYRLALILEDSRAPVVLTQEHLLSSLPGAGASDDAAAGRRLAPYRSVVIDRGSAIANADSSRPPEDVASASSNLAYVIYTSGSTGRPKGVAVEHHSVAALLTWAEEMFGPEERRSLHAATSLSFDLSVFELFLPLSCGDCVVLGIDPLDLPGLPAAGQVTMLNTVPSAVDGLLRSASLPAAARTVILAGEPLRNDLVHRIYSQSPVTRLLNCYGPTESTVYATFAEISRDITDTPPIGGPVTGTETRVLDARLEAVPAGLPGELYLGGAGLARGYFRNPAQTAERFLPHPRAVGERLYKTGDLVRQNPAGELEFLGRQDHQVKLRGHRIELEEIEAMLSRMPEIRDAVVEVREQSPNSGAVEKSLAAYITLDSDHALPLPRWQLHRLPNGVPISTPNSAEASHLYHRIFTERAYLRHGVGIADGDCIFDVGANIGLFSLFARLECHEARIFAFEPIETIADQMQLNVDLWGLPCTVLSHGLSDVAKAVRFTYYPGWSALSGAYGERTEEERLSRAFLRNQHELLGQSADDLLADRFEGEIVTCRMKTVSQVMAEHQLERIDLLKVNVEKSELDVLHGIEPGDWASIRQCVLEVHDADGRVDDAVGLLESQGFAVEVDQDPIMRDTGLFMLYARRAAASDALARSRPTVVPEPRPTDRAVAVDASLLPGLARRLIRVEALQKDLRRYLPEHMVPEAFAVLDGMPRTPSGKIDRRAVSSADQMLATHKKSVAYVPPRDALEQAVADIVSQVLGIERIGVHDDFFDVGGHSLLVTRVAARIARILRVDLPLPKLFRSTSVGQLSTMVRAQRDTARPEIPPPVRVPRHQDVPLSFSQQRLWFLHQLEPDSPAYNMPVVFRLLGRTEVGALAAAFEALADRHEILRTTFSMSGGRPRQTIIPDRGLPLGEVDLTGLAVERRARLARQLAAEEAERPFDLQHGPLIRTVLMRCGPDHHELMINIHHIIFDGWSSGVLYRDLGALYDAGRRGRASGLPRLPIQYGDFAAWQRTWLKDSVLESDLTYWRRQLRGKLPTLALPADRSRPARPSHRGALQRTSLSPELLAVLRRVSQEHGVTLFMTLLGAFLALLQRVTGQDNPIVGTPIANRRRPELEDLIGFFVNSLVLRGDLTDDPSFSDLLERIHDLAVAAYAHQDLPFEMLVERIAPHRDPSRNPLFQVLFALHNTPGAGFELRGLRTLPVGLDVHAVRFDLELHLCEIDGGLRGDWLYSVDLFDATTVIRVAGHFAAMLEAAAAQPERRLSELPVVTGAQRHQLLLEWNATRRARAEWVGGVHCLVATRAARMPAAVAVAAAGTAVCYGEMVRGAAVLADRLRRLGAGPEARIAVLAAPTPARVTALLGVLASGAAYVPLDPEFPAARLTAILEDCQPELLLTDGCRSDVEPPASVRALALTESSTAGRAVPAFEPAEPENLAYVIYTSGSTGRPKGVQITHRALVNFLSSMARQPGLSSADVLLAVTTISFDIAALEVFLPLLRGARLELADRAAAVDGEVLARLSTEVRATVIQATPATWQLLLEADWRAADLRAPGARGPRVLCGGEALPGGLADRLMAAGSELWNLYGPTETTVWSALHQVGTSSRDGGSKTATVALGRPIANTGVHLVDRRLRPLPPACMGELAIGGAGLMRGYWARPAASAEKLVPDPWSQEPGTRLFRTGDLARRRGDGILMFLGRRDHQVKLRGHRIELGEIESTLLSHPAVREAAAALREDNGRRSLIAYLALRSHPEGGQTQRGQHAREDVQGGERGHLDAWQTVWDQVYSQPRAGEDGLELDEDGLPFDVSGWNSSYTGEPIPQAEMREWVATTVDRILALRPRRVLEIGCGTGLLLARIAPRCERYTATDFSPTVVDRLRTEVDPRQVELRVLEAHDVAGIEVGAFDTVILNSVAQYFPSIDYLQRVLREAIRVVAPGGRIFVGDVRHLGLLDMFCADRELHRAEDTLELARLRQLVARLRRSEEELLIAPAFFLALRSTLPRVGRVGVVPKAGRFHNELTRFRYDVVIELDGDASEPPAELDWHRVEALAGLRGHLEEHRPAALWLRGVPNARLTRQRRLSELLAAPNGLHTAGELRRVLDEVPGTGVEPRALEAVGEALGYDVELSWADGAAAGSFAALLHRGATLPPPAAVLLPPAALLPPPIGRDEAARGPAAWANEPLRTQAAQRLLPRLREHLRQHLPPYMVPAKLIVLDVLPRTANGKLDRGALPAPAADRSLLAPTYVAPETRTEHMVAAAWRDVLGLERVGLEDNFFDAGGHSLLLPQVLAVLRRGLQVELTILDLLQHPTIRGLVGRIDGERSPLPAPRTARPTGDRRRLRAMARQRSLRRQARGDRS